eukprot:TRINITY_DN1223_c0_g1_i2.p1 TRINITY_DN1223_c0_g1~~TRINITY_DN1223_c0_g1_i2.p1  ORF type:complete len:185 (-),score=25.41 TRINITY_DN1223_c0_g1_i2:47-601(-)
MVKDVLADFSFIDILVNNAGTASVGKSVVDTDPKEMIELFNTHVMGSFYMCKLVIPQMRKLPTKRGDIVMISSVLTKLQGAKGAPYNIAKNGLEALALTLTKEERRFGIRVNMVNPGLVETDMGNTLVNRTTGQKNMDNIHAAYPFGKVCQPEDVAHVVGFFCTTPYITGEKIYVDGGGFFPKL